MVTLLAQATPPFSGVADGPPTTPAARRPVDQQIDQQSRPLFGADVSMVTINVAVLEGKGLPVAGLSAEDFRVFEDGVPQEVALLLRPDALPADIGLLVDLSGSVRDDALALRRDALAFLDALADDDCVYFLPFANEVGDGTWGRPQGAELRAAIERAQIGGATPLYDALIRAIGALDDAAERCVGSARRGGASDELVPGLDAAEPALVDDAGTIAARRRAIVVLTDGGDTSSQAAYAAAVNAAAVAGVPIFPVAIGNALTPGQTANLGPAPGRGDTPAADARVRSKTGSGLMSESERGRDTDFVSQAVGQGLQERYDARLRSYGLGLAASLHEIAAASGGAYVDGGANEEALRVAYGEVLTWLRASYVIGYYPPRRPAAAVAYRGRATWRQVSVHTVDDGLRVFARPGYFERDVDPVAAAAAVDAGIDMLRNDLAREAVSAFGAALEADPYSWQAHYYRGRAFGVLGRLNEARHDFLAAARLAPGIGEVHEFAAIASADAGDGAAAWEQAIRALQAGHDMSARLDMLRAVAPPPADLAQQLEVPRLYVGPAVVPDPEAQAVLEAVLRSVRRSIAASRGFALVLDAGRADHVVRVQINDLDTGGPGRVSGELAIYRPDGERELAADFSVDAVFDDDAIDGVLAGVLAESLRRIRR